MAEHCWHSWGSVTAGGKSEAISCCCFCGGVRRRPVVLAVPAGHGRHAPVEWAETPYTYDRGVVPDVCSLARD